MKNLPVGQDNFENLIHDNCVYVDKTEYIHRLISGGKRNHFLSRPRRFGKSLLLSTIKAVFEGKRELFEGLYIEDKIDWRSHPVVTLDMSFVDASSISRMDESFRAMLDDIADSYGVSVRQEIRKPILAG